MCGMTRVLGRRASSRSNSIRAGSRAGCCVVNRVKRGLVGNAWGWWGVGPAGRRWVPDLVKDRRG